MNTGQLKKFAQEARKKLLEQIGAKLSFVLTTDSSELREKGEQVNQLREELSRISKEQLIEKVAYTWFNRLMAIRFMDANDYQPFGIRVITPKDGYTTPELLDEAKRGNIPEELKLKRQRVFDLLDNRIPSTNPQNEAYKELLIAACNHLNTILPFLFEKISDYSELLLPDDLTSQFSIVTDIRNGMLIVDCSNVEIIGWLYQFYISEKKDEVFASKSTVKKEDIPAATQLFTPRWIVEYMVQNSLGKLWLQNRPKSRLKEYMPYFIESVSQSTDEYLKIDSPEEIKLLDPASGSGHILVYAFDLFTKIYEEEGYSAIDIPKLIIENNLNGFEIDERAAQLSGLALMMKAREYHRRAFKKDIKPNILTFIDLNLSKNDIKETFNILQIKVTDALFFDLLNMQQATNLGSLMMPKVNPQELTQLSVKLNKNKSAPDMFLYSKIVALQTSVNQIHRLSLKYHCIAINPPYMGSRKMNPALNKFVSISLPHSKADLMSCFMERALEFLLPSGIVSMINFQSWMFLSSFEEMRKNILTTCYISNLVHIGRGVFGSDSGTVAFSIQNSFIPITKSQFIRIFEREVQVESNEIKKARFLNKQYQEFFISQNALLAIPGNPISYWISDGALKSYVEGTKLSDIADVTAGLATGDNTLFVRFWYEVATADIKRLCKKVDVKDQKEKWFPYNKGGEFNKWYGNQELVINWLANGSEIKALKNKQLAEGKITANNSKCWNESKYFLPSISWTKVSYDLSVRYYPDGFVFDIGGCSIFAKDEDTLFILGLLNSKLVKPILGPISPTVNFEPGQLKTFPIHVSYRYYTKDISDIVEQILKLTMNEFDLYENNWSFKSNEICILSNNHKNDIEEACDLFIQFWTNKFYQLKHLEENINNQLIAIYGLQNEIIPDLKLKDITILKELTIIENEKLVFQSKILLNQFISFAVGCIFGRYSIDKEGLILANKGETLKDYLHKIGNTANECNFLPDEDNIVPVLDEEWFDDDITGRFSHFLKATFGEKNFNKNLAFIEEQIGNDIRTYFIKDFYSDHIKRYKKRPIYWMFSSPKGSFNVIFYVHRYTPDTVSNILNKYLKEFIGKLKTRKEHLEHIQVTGSPSEKVKAIKEIEKIKNTLIELHDYERDILYPLATERIAIDLDDGVLVNYNKFGKAIKEVDGLNDQKTKEKVIEFDWIDATEIR